MGTWASAVTAAVAPVCWESKTFLTTVSGADSITLLPHQGYLIRTQPNNHLQAAKHAEFIASLGAKRVFMHVDPGAVFAADAEARSPRCCRRSGSELVGALIYGQRTRPPTAPRSTRRCRATRTCIYLNGYAPDVTILLRDLYRAGFDGGALQRSPTR